MYLNAKNAITAQGVWRSVIENKHENAMAIDFDFWEMSEEEKDKYLTTILDNSFINHVVFCPCAAQSLEEMTKKVLLKCLENIM